VKKFDIIDKKIKKNFFIEKGVFFYQKLHEESEKNGPDAPRRRFWVPIGVF